jgi:predicted DNA-binding protein with PD1-like motif
MPASRSTVTHPGPVSDHRRDVLEGTAQAELRIVIEPGRNLFDALHEVFSKRAVTHARIRIVGGAFSSLYYHTAIPDPAGRLVVTYGQAEELDGGGQIVTAHGIYGLGTDGRPILHLHGALLDRNGSVFGGHLPSPRMVTRSRVTVWAVALAHAGFRVLYDTETDMSIFQPVATGQQGEV